MIFEKSENMDKLNLHMQTVHFKEFGKAIEEFLAENMKIYMYSVVKFD
jgi:quinol monooxygenase YgiN